MDGESPKNNRLNKVTNHYGIEKNERNYLKKSKCDGDYCNVDE